MPPSFSFGTSQRGGVKQSNHDGPGPGVIIILLKSLGIRIIEGT